MRSGGRDHDVCGGGGGVECIMVHLALHLLRVALACRKQWDDRTMKWCGLHLLWPRADQMEWGKVETEIRLRLLLVSAAYWA